MEGNFIGYLPDTIDGIDEFGVHTKIAEAVSEKIINADVKKHPLTLGLFGEWGSGKSFIVEKVRQDIKAHSDIAFINIDVWKYNGIPLLRHVLYEIAEQGPTSNFEIKDKERLVKDIKKVVLGGTKIEEYKSEAYLKIEKAVFWGKWILLIGAVLSVVLDFFPEIPQIFKSIFDTWTIPATIYAFIFQKVNDEVLTGFANVISRMKDKIVIMDETIVPTISPEQFEQEFDNIINKFKQYKIMKYVIVFDNIDRCKGDFAYDVLSTIKTYMNKENCIYLIPCDDIAIKHYLDREYRIDQSNKHQRDFGVEFLDKLFNAYVRVPYINELSRDKFIDKCLSEIPSFSNVKQKSKIVEVLYYAYKGETPRQIKKYINDLLFYYEIALKVDPQKEFLLDDMKTFIIMIAIKQIYPDFEKALISNPSLIKEMNDTKFIEVKEMLMKSQFEFPESKSALSYIFMSKDENEFEVINKIKNAEPVELNDFNMMISSKSMRSDRVNKVFLQNQFNGILLSILNYGVKEFLIIKSDNKYADTLYRELRNCVKPFDGHEFCVAFLKNNCSLTVDELKDVFFLFENFDMNVRECLDLFKKIEGLPNYSNVYAAFVEMDFLSFNKAISQYFNELSLKEKTEENSVINKLLTPELLNLLSSILDRKKYTIIPTNLVEKISKCVTFENEEWKSLEKRLIKDGGFDIAFSKIYNLSQTCDELIQPRRVNLTTNANDLFEQLDYLISYLDLSVEDILRKSSKEELENLEIYFGRSLIKLVNLSDKANKLFLLSVKLFGEKIINKYFIPGTVFYDKRVESMLLVYNDEELLERFEQSDKFKHEIISNEHQRKMLLENINVDWKRRKISYFVYSPLNLQTCMDFYESETWSEAIKDKITKTVIQKFILTIEKYMSENIISEADVLAQFKYMVSISSGNQIKTMVEDPNRAIMEKIVKEKLNMYVAFLKELDKESLEAKLFLEFLLRVITEDNAIYKIDIVEYEYICEIIEYDLGDALIKKICPKFLTVANKDSIIAIGMKLMEKSRSKSYIVKNYKDQLELIKDAKRFVDRIDEILSSKEVKTT